MSKDNKINMNDKMAVRGRADINQVAPYKYKWALEYFRNSFKNKWFPEEVNMTDDIVQYPTLSEVDKNVFENVLAYLSTADIIAMRNIGLAVMEKMTAPELQLYQATQVYEEAVHTYSYQYIVESLGLDPNDIYNRYKTVPEIAAKINYSGNILDKLTKMDADLSNDEDLYDFLHGLFYFSAIFEGNLFYNGFTPIYALQRRNLMSRTGEELQFIMRDEASHITFGLRLIKTIMSENDIELDVDWVYKTLTDVEALEEDYARLLMPGIFQGYSVKEHMRNFRALANRRCKAVGIEPLYDTNNVVSPWLDEAIYLVKEENFFETPVTNYQAGFSLEGTWRKDK